MKKLLTIALLALLLTLACTAALAEVRYVAWFQIDQDKTDTTIPVNITIPSGEITVKGVTYYVMGMSFDRVGSYVDCYTGLYVPQDKAHCGKELVVYVQYDTGEFDVWGNPAYGYEGYTLIAVDHIWRQTSHTQTEGTFKCAICGATKKDEPIHDYVETTLVAPTCTTDGSSIMMCSCGLTWGPAITLKGEHNWFKVEVAPHCIEGAEWWMYEYGYVYWECSYCGCHLYEAYTGDEFADPNWTPNNVEIASDEASWLDYTGEWAHYFTIPEWQTYTNNPFFDGHNWNPWRLVAATCDTAGYKVHWCLRCSKNEFMPLTIEDGDFYAQNSEALGPKWTAVLNVKNLICTYDEAYDYGTNKQVYIVCERCGGSVEGHLLAKAGTNYTAKVLQYTDDIMYNARVEHKNQVNSWINADLSTPGVSVTFDVTGDDPGTVVLTASHVYSKDDMYRVYISDYTFTAADAPDMAGFTVHVNGYHVPATCTARGFTAYMCDYEDWSAIMDSLMGIEPWTTHAVIAVYDEPAPGHNWDNWVTEFDTISGDPTGWYHRKCKVCLQSQVSHADGKPCDVHTPMQVVVVEPTCEFLGTYMTICIVCGADLDEYGFIDELGHDWQEVSRDDATCTAEGLLVEKCSRCGLYANSVLPMIEHTPVDVAEVPATCKEAGVTAGKKCAVCGEKLEGFDPIPKTDKHSYGEEIVSQPTCIKDGKKLLTCSVCGDTKTEAIPATGVHTLTEVAAVEATCKTEGAEAYFKCSVCGKMFADKEATTEITAPKPVPADPEKHVWEVTFEKAPTCTEAGMIAKKCSVCGVEKTEAPAALGHNADEGTVVEEPTIEKEGKLEIKCTRCGVVLETKPIPKVVPEAEYTVSTSDFVYDMNEQKVTGKVEHVEGTKELDTVYARVSFFYRDKTWAAFVLPVKADGSFKMGANTDAVYITVEIVNNEDATQIPDDDEVFGSGRGTVIPLD